MKDEPTIPEGWIRHDGGPMPVAALSPVRLLYRGAEAPSMLGMRIPFAAGGRMDWSHDGGPDDIIAYKPEQQP